MPDRTINWGDSETEATYQTGDDDPAGGGNFVVARDTDGGVTLLEYDPVAGEWVSRGDVNLDGNDLSANVVDAASVSAEDSFTDPSGKSITSEIATTLQLYSDSDAISAINNDTDHGSTALHNYFSGSHTDLSNVTADQHHTKTQSSDITVTDTQPGAVSDGEFLQNNNGSLEGGNVQTEPNVPNWVEDANSPYDSGSSASHTYTLASQYDLIKIIVDGSNTGSNNMDSMRVNGNTDSGYNYRSIDGSRTTSSDRIALGNFVYSDITIEGRSGDIRLNFSPTESLNGLVVSADYSGASNVTQFEIYDSGGFGEEMRFRVYGLDI